MLTGTLIAQVTSAAHTGGNDALLPLLVLVPLIGALAVALIRDATITRTIAIGFSIASLVLAILLLWKLPGVNPNTHAAAGNEMTRVWSLRAVDSSGFGPSIRAALSADAISGWLVALTAVLTLCAMVATATGVQHARAYFAWFLLLEASIAGAFLSSDLLLFYFFFELTLVPSFFLIGQWGGVDRRQAATKFFVYTFAGSLFMLASILYLAFQSNSFDMATCARFAQTNFSNLERMWVLLGLLAGLAVKVPLLPVHTWLPITYTQSPPAVTAVVAGALGKLGTYGLLRIAVPMGLLPVVQGHSQILSWMITLSVLAIIYAALIAWVQRDYKTLVAYSSISHLGFCVLALCCLNTMGGQASVLYMVNHGINTAALFLMLGMIEARAGTRVLENISGLGRERPRLAFFFVLFVMASIGLPFTNGFVSEFLSLQSTVAAGLPILVTILATSGVVLGAIYMLHLTAKLIFGPSRQPTEHSRAMPDLTLREMSALLPLAILVIALGVQPNIILKSIEAPVQTILATGPSGTRTLTAVRADGASVEVTATAISLGSDSNSDRASVGVIAP